MVWEGTVQRLARVMKPSGRRRVTRWESVRRWLSSPSRWRFGATAFDDVRPCRRGRRPSRRRGGRASGDQFTAGRKSATTKVLCWAREQAGVPPVVRPRPRGTRGPPSSGLGPVREPVAAMREAAFSIWYSCPAGDQDPPAGAIGQSRDDVVLPLRRPRAPVPRDRTGPGSRGRSAPTITRGGDRDQEQEGKENQQRGRVAQQRHAPSPVEPARGAIAPGLAHTGRWRTASSAVSVSSRYSNAVLGADLRQPGRDQAVGVASGGHAGCPPATATPSRASASRAARSVSRARKSRDFAVPTGRSSDSATSLQRQVEVVVHGDQRHRPTGSSLRNACSSASRSARVSDELPTDGMVELRRAPPR